MGNNGAKQNIRRTGRNVWIALLILVILLIVTIALLGACLRGLSGKDRNVIPLFYEGDREILGENGLSYIRAEEVPNMAAQDEQARWEINTSVDLFKTAYANDQGVITVKSENGDKLIAPGTTGTYEFSLKNTGNISMDYTMRLDSVFTLLNQELPMRVRLRSGDRWLLGGENDWARPDELTGLTETGTVAVNQYTTFTFEWQWPFESGGNDALLGDLGDTLIGNTAVTQEVEFLLEIGVLSTVTPGAVPMDPQGTELLEELTLWNVLKWVVFPGLLGMILLLLIFWRTPVYVTGFLPGGGELCLDKKKAILRPVGRFVFPRVYMGKHSLTLGPARCRIKLKRKRGIPGIAFERKDGVLVISVGRRVRAIELYLLPGLTPRRDEWAAIDRDHNVITPVGVKPPDGNKENTTPGGLHISGNGEVDAEAFAGAK